MEIKVNPSADTNILLRVLKVSLLFVFLGSFGVFFLGHSLLNINRENQQVNAFLEMAANAQPDFEKSLSMYTQNTEEDISYINSLRPDGEVDYITFLSAIESLAQDLSVSVVIETLDGKTAISLDQTGSSFLDYKISFYGNSDQFVEFLSGLEWLPYFIRVSDFEYVSLENVISRDDFERPNISLTLRLYVK